jgi:dihydrofolate reductase
LIVAMSSNRVIGRDGQLPWRLSADLRRFKRITMGHAIIMGRKTYESIGRPLPGRRSIVVTRQADFAAPGIETAGDPGAALRMAADDSEAFFIGGAEIYRHALELVARIYLTQVHADLPGDTYFPAIDFQRWRRLEQTRFPADEKNEFEHSFLVYERKAEGGRLKAEGGRRKAEG